MVIKTEDTDDDVLEAVLSTSPLGQEVVSFRSYGGLRGFAPLVSIMEATDTGKRHHRAALSGPVLHRSRDR